MHCISVTNAAECLVFAANRPFARSFNTTDELLCLLNAVSFYLNLISAVNSFEHGVRS